MTPLSSPRHLLVVAPQCADLGPLDGLEEVAGALHDALADRSVGGCVPALPGESSLLCGPDVGQARIEKAVRTAAERAGRAEATLVLAFLGHGTTPGDTPRLCFMAGDSRADAPTTVVDVPGLVTDALDTPGVQGVVALVDTCHAGGAVPDMMQLGAGIRRGATMLSLVTSVSVAEEAYGLAFTRGLVRVLREGVADGGEFLTAHAVRDAVNATAGTGAQVVTANGDAFGQHPWVARNARHARAGGRLFGTVGEEALRWALEPLGALVPEFPLDSSQDLELLRESLSVLSKGAKSDAPALLAAARVTDGLADAHRTTDLLLRWPGGPLTSLRIRRAFSAAAGGAAPAPRAEGGELLRECVELLRLRVPRAGGSRTAPLAAFVAALAVEDELTAQRPELAAWAAALQAVVELNDAFAALTERTAEGRLRLVVSLHAAVADNWPESLLVWLLDRDTLVRRQEFPCVPTQQGVEEALGTVLAWAAPCARQTGLKLRHVDIAAPAPLLAYWHPEETRVGRRLGTLYNVVLRWSDRLCPPAHAFWINDYARDRLDAMDKGNGTPLDWLGREETGRADDLADRLENGPYERALALAHRPDRLEDYLPALLAYAPIVLWPRQPGELPAASRAGVERHWDLLPAELSAAYRSAWKQHPGGPELASAHADLAQVRSVWLDAGWLDFCDWFDTRSGEGESSE
ncbi:hypothetical protein ACIQVK_41225 [Streptomyces sp. NPDC090493]|uniref:vWA-MoxR associated conflict system protein n=1 Tax=Streptomyces sp. NPDC090493 TaxID=3365964 RepID=UPI00382F0D48